MNADSRSTMVFPKGIAHQDEKSLQETNEALATGANPSLVSDLIPFPARLDGLFTDQSPEDFAEADPCLNDRCSDALIVHRMQMKPYAKSSLLANEIISLQAFLPWLSKKPSHDLFAPLSRHHRISINDRLMVHLHLIEQK